MKKLLTLVLALMMVLSLSATALAAGEGEGTVQTDPPATSGTVNGTGNNGTGNAADGHTTIGIVSTTAKTSINPETGEILASQLEFEVPLYVVLAVGKELTNASGVAIANTKLGAKGEGSVICPTEPYYIKGLNDTAPIGVKTMTFSSIAAGGWKTVATTSDLQNVTGAKTMAMKIGNDYMPAVAIGASKTLRSTGLTVGDQDFATNSLFYKDADSAQGPAAIGTTALELPIIARVQQSAITDQDVTRAFKIVYTIGLVDEGAGEGGENEFLTAAIFTYLGSDLVSSKLG